jgi:hypothetical protein
MAADEKSALKLFFDGRFHTLHTRVPTQKLITLSGISCVTIQIPTIHKKYRKQNKQPKRKLVRQIILEINSLDM